MPWPTTPPSFPLPLLFFVSGTAVIPHVLGWTVLSLSGTTSPHPTPEILEQGWCVPLLWDACATSGHYFSQFTVTADFSRERTTADSGLPLTVDRARVGVGLDHQKVCLAAKVCM